MVPRSGDRPDLPVAFFAFVTAARADDADGRGKALDRSTKVPADANQTDAPGRSGACRA